MASVWIGGYIMRIQAANTFYTGTYSVLNTKSSFPYKSSYIVVYQKHTI